MQLIRGWSKKTGKGKGSVPKNTSLNFMIPIMENILNHKCLIISTNSQIKQTHRLVSLLRIDKGFSFGIQLTANFSENLVKYSGRLMKNDRIYSIPSKDLRINLMHKLLQKKENSDESCLMKVSQQTGEIQVFILTNYSSTIMNNLGYFKKEAAAQIKRLVIICQKKLGDILLEINQNNVYTEQVKLKKQQNLDRIHKHIFFSNHNVGWKEEKPIQKKPKAKQKQKEKQKEKQKNTKIIANKQNIGHYNHDLKWRQLYGIIPMIQIHHKYKEIMPQICKLDDFQSLLQIPTPKTNNSSENIYIFNEINIIDPQKIRTQQLPAQANSTFKVSNIYFRYAPKKQINREQTKEKKGMEFNKLVVIKQGKNESVKSWNKLTHQKNIVRTFNSASSAYVINYYNYSQENFAYRKGLMMEYNPCGVTLSEHLLKNRESLSLDSKMQLLIHISNSLRFLQSSNIVHMDLNLNNILIYDGYLPKLIDFGQAYHKQVVEMQSKYIKYSPGYTLPYCSPEVFAKNTFSSLQDIFSFGIIMFRVLTSAFPYFPSDSLIQLYKNRSYHSKFMLAVENVQCIARPEIVSLLLQLIGKCLQGEEENRSLPVWCTIILKQIHSQVFC